MLYFETFNKKTNRVYSFIGKCNHIFRESSTSQGKYIQHQLFDKYGDAIFAEDKQTFEKECKKWVRNYVKNHIV